MVFLVKLSGYNNLHRNSIKVANIAAKCARVSPRGAWPLLFAELTHTVNTLHCVLCVG